MSASHASPTTGVSHAPIHPPSPPLRQRLIDDMTIRRLAPKTQVAYVNGVKKFAAFLHVSPDKATTDDLRLFRLELARSALSVTAINQTMAGIRFFYSVTLPQEPMLAIAKYIRQPDQLPVVLSTEEIARLLACAPNFKYKVMLTLCYSAGLRVSELVGLKVSDIDSSRMVIRVQQAKGWQGPLHHPVAAGSAHAAPMVPGGREA